MGKYADRVLEVSSTIGIGDFTLGGAIVGYRSFNAAIGVNSATEYCIVAVDGSGTPTGDWEVGLGHLSDAATLVRDRVLAGTNGSLYVSFTAGSKRVFITHAADEIVSYGKVHAAVSGLRMP